MLIETISLDRINPAPYNPRVDLQPGDVEYEKIKRSIEEFSLVEPLVWNKRTGFLVGGHQRLKVLQNSGIAEVQVSVVDLDDSQERALNIALNKAQGEWDFPKLRDLLSELNESGYDISATGYSAKEFADLVNKLFSPDASEFDDVVPPVPEVPVSKTGDLYALGEHLLLCGDACSLDDLSAVMGSAKAAMVFTDPPYNVDYGATMKDKLRGNNAKILNDKMSDESFYQFLYDCVSAMRPFVLGDVYICMSSSELHTLQKAFVACGGHWSTFIIWVKQHFTMGRSNYQRQYVPILYGWFDKSSHYWSGVRNLGDVIKTEEVMYIGADAYLRVDGLSMDVWEVGRPTKSALHPTMKPVALCGRGILNSSKLGDIVLDPFGGSGSTLIACEKLKRSCRMIEMDPKYCDVIVKRWEDYTGGKAVLLDKEN